MTLEEAVLARDAVEEFIAGPAHGQVAGVTFDFRHEELDPQVWRLSESLDNLPIWFPWTDEQEAAWWEFQVAAGNADAQEKLPEENASLEPGDKLYISRVVSLGGGNNPLEVSTDGETRFAYFAICKPGGEEVPIQTPLLFVAKGAIQAHSLYLETPDDDRDLLDHLAPFSITFEKISARIESLDDTQYEKWTRLATWSLMYANEELKEAQETLPFAATAIIDLVATAAYALARAEAEARVVPHAEHWLKAKADNERSRALAIKARRDLGEKTRERARALMRRNSRLSWTACANELADGRDPRGVARVIEPLFPKGPDGVRRYVGTICQNVPGFQPDRP